MNNSVASRRRSRAERTEANRHAVLVSAGVVFRERGYAAATLDQIAEAAGFSKGVIYSQFASKADLFLHLLDKQIADRAEQNAAAVEQLAELDPDAVIRLLHGSLSRRDPAWRLAVTEFRIAAARDPELRRRYDESHRRTVERLAVLCSAVCERTGHSPPVPVEHLAATILALDVGVVLEDVSTLRPIPDESLDLLMRRLVFGV
jgi:AcrR family transcriptional regulator